MKTPILKTAKIGTVSHGTLRAEDLIHAFIAELESLMLRNGGYFAAPENRQQRDSLLAKIGEAQDAFNDDGETIKDEFKDVDFEIVEELTQALEFFAPEFCYFGTTEGDGSDFGFWPVDIESIKESLNDSDGFVSSRNQEFPPEDFQGTWLHINERGNCTLYSRVRGQDSEIWSIV